MSCFSNESCENLMKEQKKISEFKTLGTQKRFSKSLGTKSEVDTKVEGPGGLTKNNKKGNTDMLELFIMNFHIYPHRFFHNSRGTSGKTGTTGNPRALPVNA